MATVQPLTDFIVATEAPAVVGAPAPAENKSGYDRRHVILALSVVLVIIVLFLLYRRNRKGKASAAAGDLTKKLSDKKWMLYVSPTCGYCTQQLSLLGAKFNNTITCGSSPQLADSPLMPLCKDVKAFPYWINLVTREERTGLQTLEQLKEMAA